MDKESKVAFGSPSSADKVLWIWLESGEKIHILGINNDSNFGDGGHQGRPFSQALPK